MIGFTRRGGTVYILSKRKNGEVVCKVPKASSTEREPHTSYGEKKAGPLEKKVQLLAPTGVGKGSWARTYFPEKLSLIEGKNVSCGGRIVAYLYYGEKNMGTSNRQKKRKGRPPEWEADRPCILSRRKKKTPDAKVEKKKADIPRRSRRRKVKRGTVNRVFLRGKGVSSLLSKKKKKKEPDVITGLSAEKVGHDTKAKRD